MTRRSDSRERGQSSVIGVVLVVAVTVMGVTGIMLFGASALADARTQSEINAAEHAMTQLDSRFSLVALGSSERQESTVDLEEGATLRVDGDAGWMNVSVYNRTDDGELEHRILNVTLGAVIYENDGTTIAYQGGGVWKKSESGGSVMVSPPEFHYRLIGGEDPTLTLPLVVVRGSGSLTEQVAVESGETIPKFPNASEPGLTNPLGSGEINITVHSDYYQAWGAFFEQRTGGDVTYDHDRKEVTIILLIEESSPTISGGIVSGAAGTTLEFQNKASADSYNSSAGNYSATDAKNTSIVAAGSVTLNNQATLYGDLVAGGTVTLQNKAEITGNVSYGGTLDVDSNAVIGGWTESGAEVTVPNAVDWLIDARRTAISDSNNNNDSDVDISDNSLVGCDLTCELDAGDYYLESIALGEGDELVIDTSGGIVEIVVDGDVSLNNDAKIRTTGGGTVKFYVEGDLSLTNNANVSVPGQRSPGMWFYMNPGSSADFNNQAHFVGVIYGPGDGAYAGVDIGLTNQVEIYGGLVGKVGSVNNGIGLHFDEALADENPLQGYAAGHPTVTYMHVTVNRVNVSSS